MVREWLQSIRVEIYLFICTKLLGKMPTFSVPSTTHAANNTTTTTQSTSSREVSARRQRTTDLCPSSPCGSVDSACVVRVLCDPFPDTIH